MSDYSNKLNLFLDIQKSFSTLKASTEVPDIFKDIVKGEKGNWAYGVGSNSDIDMHGERVILTDAVARTLEQAPLNKLLLEHDTDGKNVGGISSIGIIKFSRIVPSMDNQHIILAKLNDEHQRFKNIWGSIQNKNIDSFSISGRAERVEKFNHETQQTEILRPISKLVEVSATSLPANGGAGILGSFVTKSLHNSDFVMPLRGHGGVEFFKTEETKMENNEGFVSMDTYNKDMGDLKDLMKQLVDSKEKTNEAIKSMHEGNEKLLKAFNDEDTPKEGGDDAPASEETPVEPAKEETPPAGTAAEPVAQNANIEMDAMKKQMEALDSKMESFQKTMPSAPVVSNTGRPDDIQKNASGQGGEELSPFCNLLGGR